MHSQGTVHELGNAEVHGKAREHVSIVGAEVLVRDKKVDRLAVVPFTGDEVSKLLSTFSARTVGGDQPAPRPLTGGGGGCCGGGCGCRH